MIDDIAHARFDMLVLAERHQLSPVELAKWIEQPENQECLSSLCVLADLQAQLLLSRYRVQVTKRLFELATDGESQGEVARRACVDLLKLDLKRADVELAKDGAGKLDLDSPEGAVAAMREMLGEE